MDRQPGRRPVAFRLHPVCRVTSRAIQPPLIRSSPGRERVPTSVSVCSQALCRYRVAPGASGHPTDADNRMRVHVQDVPRLLMRGPVGSRRKDVPWPS